MQFVLYCNETFATKDTQKQCTSYIYTYLKQMNMCFNKKKIKYSNIQKKLIKG